jgi:hypothetical protein
MAAKKSGYSPVKSGYDPRTEEKGAAAGAGSWLTLKDGEYADVTILVEKDDIIACEQAGIYGPDMNVAWVYTGPDDPANDLDIKKTYRAYLPVMTKEGDPKVFGMSKTTHILLLDMADVASIKGSMVRIKRTGEKLNTKYSISPMGKRKDVDDVEEVDVVSMLGPLTSDEVKDMLVKKFEVDDYSDVLRLLKGKGGSAKPKAKAKPKTEEDEIDELELES